MDITTALLCDFAQVRERLLFVSSGGVTRLWRTELPAPLGLFLGAVIEIDAVEAERQHEIEVVVLDQDGREAARVKGNFNLGRVETEAGEQVALPIAFDLRQAPVRSFGPHDVRLYLNGEHRRTLRFRVVERPQQTPQPPAPEPGPGGIT